jgi:hypothetical protein
VTCNAVNPGIVPGTGLLRDRSEAVRRACRAGWLRVCALSDTRVRARAPPVQYRYAFQHIAAPVWSLATAVVTPAVAAKALIAAAEAHKGGHYFEGTDPEGSPAKQTRDEALQTFMWDDTARLLGLEWPLPGL